MPRLVGSSSSWLTEPPSTSRSWLGPAREASSRPPQPCTTTARPNPSRARASAIGSSRSGRATPSTWASGRSGFTSGPSRLNTVRTPRLRRRGARPTRAGCQPGANRNVTPALERAATTCSWGACSCRPSPSSTSAEPTRPLALRLPCLATWAPQAAARKATAVEMLKLSAPSPPVPQVSTRESGGRPAGWGQAWRSTRAIAASSSPLTPLARRAASRAPVSTGGISWSSQPCIRRAAASPLRASPASRCSSRAGQLGVWASAAAIASPPKTMGNAQFNSVSRWAAMAGQWVWRAQKSPGAEHTGPGDGDPSTIPRNGCAWRGNRIRRPDRRCRSRIPPLPGQGRRSLRSPAGSHWPRSPGCGRGAPRG